MIPVYEPPYPDEYLYGWLLRLSRINGCEKLKQFLYSLFYDKQHNIDNRYVPYQKQSIGGIGGLYWVSKLHYELPPILDMIKSYAFDISFPALPQHVQAKRIHAVLYNSGGCWI